MKRGEKAINLYRQMNAAYARHDWQSVFWHADKLLRKMPRNEEIIEKLASLYIDFGLAKEAQQVTDFLQRNFSLNGYRYFLLGRAAQLQNDYAKAIELVETGLHDSHNASWQRELMHNILGRMYKDIGESEQAVSHYYEASQCRESYAAIDDYSNYLFNLHYLPVSREKLYAAARGYQKYFQGIRQFPASRQYYQHEKIRIGYISPDLRRHVTAFFSSVFFTEYNKQDFEVYAYANCNEDSVSHSFAAAIDGWRNIQYLPADKIAQQVMDDEIDILVDLAGHTAGNSLNVLAYHPAPVQLSGIGWFDTTGMSAVDYFLSDYYLDPPGLNEEYFSEKILRLPHSHFCYTWHDTLRPIGPVASVKTGCVTFGSFNHFSKVNDDVLSVWAEILQRVPGSRLYLKASIMDISMGRAQVERHLREAGIPLERVILEGEEIDYLHGYERMDIALDTWPYPGGGTTCDALYMGVPVITMVGSRHNSRFGYSLLMNLDLPELCAESKQEYVEKAVSLAENLQRREFLHLHLRNMMETSPIMDSSMYMLEVEALYKSILQKKWDDDSNAGDLEAIENAFDYAFWQKDLQGMAACVWEVCRMWRASREIWSAAQGFLEKNGEILIPAALKELEQGHGRLARQYLEGMPDAAYEQFPFLNYLLALAYYQDGQWRNALQYFDKYDVLEGAGDDELVYFFRGNCYAKLMSFTDARKQYQKALQKHKGFLEAESNLKYIESEKDAVALYPWKTLLPVHSDDEEACYNIPIFINSRDRLAPLQQLVKWLLSAGYQNIIILDNQSSYSPLLSYYQSLANIDAVNVIYLDKNYGYKALWDSGILNTLEMNVPYVYTDSDVVPDMDCAPNIVQQLLVVLEKNRFLKKAGIALKYQDITFYNRKAIQRKEAALYSSPLEKNVYYAAVDTTFALYVNCRHYSLRLAVRYKAGMLIHYPWYYDYNNLPRDEAYYAEHADNSSSTLNELRLNN